MAQQQEPEVRQKNSIKKLKERKVPQRGLGVAQLERIRLESQKRPPTTQQSHSSSSAMQCAPPIFRHNSLPSPTTISFPQPPPTTATDLSPQNTILRRVSSTPCTGIGHLHPAPVPFLETPDGGGVDKGWPVISNQPNHHVLVTYHPNMNMAYETGPVCRPPNVIVQRAQQIQEKPSPSSMVNVMPPLTSTSPSVITYHQVELPSNQSIYDKNYAVVWSEAQIVGMKRSYPFSLDPPSHSYPSKLPQMVAPSPKNPDESGVSRVNGSVANAGLGNLILREGSSRSTPMSSPNAKEIGKEIKDLNRDFLTLAQPRTASPTLDNREISDRETSSFQGNAGHPDRPPGPSESTHQRPFYSFFPPTKAQTREATTKSSGGSREVGEKLDLNLKL